MIIKKRKLPAYAMPP